MAGLVEEIQRDAFDQTIRISSLLRKVRAAASKLGLPPTEKWVEQELNGYTDEPPQYRKLKGSPKALNPYQGWIPIILNDKRLDGLLSSCSVRQSVASIEALLESNEADFVQYPISPGMIIELNKVLEVQFGTMAIHLSTSQLHGLLDAVRNLVLDWALQLERAGINGDGMSFNKDEKTLAHSAPTFNIGSIGSMVGNLGYQNTSGDIHVSRIDADQIVGLTNQIRPHLSQLKKDGADADLLEQSLGTLDVLTKKSDPDQHAVHGALKDLRNALSGAAGNLIASGAIAVVSKMLAV